MNNCKSNAYIFAFTYYLLHIDTYNYNHVLLILQFQNLFLKLYFLQLKLSYIGMNNISAQLSASNPAEGLKVQVRNPYKV